MNVKIIFLNKDLNEKIYIIQSKLCVEFGSETKVCKFIKSLYGLNQASKTMA